ncbi:alpha/beta-hydrolase [Thozetella sp. PMI_491]|nr:alpha/beta-hydrolase [Thozetella sp. PMI_491]
MLYTFALFVSVSAFKATPTIKLANGTLEGGSCASSRVNYFLSIPYAKPPVGNLRFAPPQTLGQSYGVRNATIPAPACHQFAPMFAENGTQSEDCLFVEVWAPANASQLPVRVWFFGGGDATGGVSNPAYDGCSSAAATNSIQVNVNYRLGPLGWLSLQRAGLTGNYGLQDQLLALQWVQENIEAFGGDKDKVMAFGESAGAWDVWSLATMPQAPSLMKAAVMESGGGVWLPTLAQADAFNEFYISYLNCSSSVTCCLRSKTLEELIAAVNGLPSNGAPPTSNPLATLGRGSPFSPVIDGTTVPEQPLDAGLKVPSIVGSNTNEGSIIDWGVYRLEGIAVEDLTPAHYDTFLQSAFGSLAGVVNETYPVQNAPSVFDAINEVNTMSAFRCPARRALRTGLRNGIPVWTYRFDHTPSCSYHWEVPADVLDLLGPSHIVELPFVFGNVVDLPFPAGTCNFTASEMAMSGAIMAAWASMAENGTPGAGWPAYTDEASQGIIYGDAATIGVVEYAGCDFWDAINEEASEINANRTAVIL